VVTRGWLEVGKWHVIDKGKKQNFVIWGERSGGM